MDASSGTINIMFSPETSESHAVMNDPPESNVSISSGSDYQNEHCTHAPRNPSGERLAEPDLAIRDTTVRHRAAIHPIFRRAPGSGRAGNINTLDDRIARHGGTTSSYEELPHRLRISKKHQPLTPSERVVELTKTNGILLQELAYHKDTREAEMIFLEKATKLRVDVESALAVFDRALEERSKARADAESILLNYWGIDLGDGNVEDSVF